MKTKQIIAVLIAAVLLVCCLSACSKNKVQTEESSSEKQSNITGTEAQSTVTSTNEEPATKSDGSTINQYVTLKDTATGFGIITVPTFSETHLNKDSAALANEMFADICSSIIKDIEENKTSDDTPKKDEDVPALCTVKTSLFGTTLSVLAEYNYYFAYPGCHYAAVNFNTQTGKVINPRDVVKNAGFTEDEVKAALRCFAERCMSDEWEYNVFYKLAQEKALPDGLGDPSYGWQDVLDNMVHEYEADNPEDAEESKLSCFPTVFTDEKGSLFVSANIPTISGEKYSTLVQIGPSNAKTLYLNSIDRQTGQYAYKNAMTLNAAFKAVAYTLGLDENFETYNGVKYEMEAEYIDNFEDVNGEYGPAYVIKVYTDQAENIATVGRFAVGVFTGIVWEYYTETDKWNFCPNSSGFLPEDIYTGMQEESIIAAVYNEPNELEQWCVPVIDDVDLVKYATGKSYFEADSDTALIFAKDNNTKITFVSSEMVNGKFNKKSDLYSVTLNLGECVLVHMIRTEDAPLQAVIAEAENNTGTYIIQYNSDNKTSKTEYITSSATQ